MKKFRSSYLLLILGGILLVGLFTLDLKSEQASVFSMPEFESTTNIKASDKKTSPSLQDFNDAIVNIAQETKPTVVTITTSQTVERRSGPFAEFFGRGQTQEFERHGLGSGVIVSGDGYILTNAHVIEGADEIQVKLYNDKTYDAEIVGSDPRTDIAVLNINASDLEVIELGDSEKARVGELVLAIGSPLQKNLAQSVSIGIVSAKNRNIGILRKQGGYEKFIQTDAAINPGNSGGAMVNMNGELIGINSAIASRSGGNEGVGFAVPINIAKKVMKSIIKHGHVTRGYLGMRMAGEVDRVMAKAMDLDKPYGIIVGEVTEGDPADKAGLKPDDVIHKMDGEPIKSWMQSRTAMGTASPGDNVKFTVNRDGETKEITVTLGEEPEDEQSDNNQSSNKSLDEKIGFQVRDINNQIARQLDLKPDQDGVVVTRVNPGSSAQQQGLQKGAVITKVNRQKIKDEAEFNKAIKEAVNEGDAILLKVLMGSNSMYIAFEL